MTTAKTRNGDIDYELAGTGPVLLAISGLGGLGSFWSRVRERLSARFSVLTYDHLGVGRSGALSPPYSIERMADDALALLDALAIDRTSVVGHSTGGAIGQVVAAQSPDRVEKLVLSATWPFADDYLRRLFTVRKAILERAGMEVYTELGTLLLYPAAWITQHPTDGRAASPIPSPDPAVVAGRIDALLAFDGRPYLPRIACPTLVTCAADDVVTPQYLSRSLAGLIAHAELSIFDGGGHYIPVVDPERFATRILQFLGSGRPASPQAPP